jgi:FlaA1/EpsC-like NDP-sugar epimerase
LRHIADGDSSGLNVVTILVTGSAGHLGEALMRRLRAERRSARGVDIKQSPFTDCVGSIGDRDFINACMPGVRAVIHAASLHKPLKAGRVSDRWPMRGRTRQRLTAG